MLTLSKSAYENCMLMLSKSNTFQWRRKRGGRGGGAIFDVHVYKVRNLYRTHPLSLPNPVCVPTLVLCIVAHHVVVSSFADNNYKWLTIPE